MSKEDLAPASEWPAILSAALRNADTMRDKYGDAAHGAHALKNALKRLPGHLDALAVLALLPDAGLDDEKNNALYDALHVGAIAAELGERCEEFADVIDYPIRFVWLRECPKSKGQIVLGRAKVTPKRERDLWAGPGPSPWWTIELSLPVWLLYDGMQRRRLVHHEMAHLEVREEEDEEENIVRRPATKGHDIEENASTMARFGVANKAHGQVVAYAIAHPGTARKLKEWAFDAKGQGLLFGPYGQAPAAAK